MITDLLNGRDALVDSTRLYAMGYESHRQGYMRKVIDIEGDKHQILFQRQEDETYKFLKIDRYLPEREECQK